MIDFFERVAAMRREGHSYDEQALEVLLKKAYLAHP
jgi:hypothetical protein